MGVLDELKSMALELGRRYPVPEVSGVYFPPFFPGGQPAEHEFIIMTLPGGAAGLSFVLVDDDGGDEYRSLEPGQFLGKSPLDLLYHDRNCAPVNTIIAMAAVNAVCQHVMRSIDMGGFLAADSIGLMDIRGGDRVGMVGLFKPLLKYAERDDVELVIIEKNENLKKKNPRLTITLDPGELAGCNKVICTSTTVLNDTLDDILALCTNARHVTVLGPSAGFFPDPLFRRGVDVVGGRYVRDGELLMSRIRNRERWGDATDKLSFQRKTYRGLPGLP